MNRGLRFGMVALASLCAVGCGTIQVRERRPEGRQFFAEAQVAYNEGRYEEALLKIAIFLREYPYSQLEEDALYLAAECYYAMGSLETAAWNLQEYLERYPDGRYRDKAGRRLIQIADALSSDRYLQTKELSDYKRTIAAFEKALEIYPDDAKVLVRLAALYEAVGDEERAREAYEKAIRLDPSIGEAREAGESGGPVAPGEGTKVFPPGPRLVVTTQDAYVSEPRRSYTGSRGWYVERIDEEGRYLTVSGQVQNFGDEVAERASVEVRVYDFYRNLLDAGTATLGTIRPGQSRAFRVRIEGVPEDAARWVECTPFLE